MSKLTEPIFVFIDDIDRLTAREIRDMLGLVRLTAHFPKIIYLLAFDRVKVERAHDQDGLEGGRKYLDKIVELSFDLPATSPHALGNLLIEGLDRAVSGIQAGPFDPGRGQDVAARVLAPLLSTPRDVNRYLAALPASLRMIGDEVALPDVLALEAIRLRLPDVFAQLGPMTRRSAQRSSRICVPPFATSPAGPALAGRFDTSYHKAWYYEVWRGNG